jgi:hypothetical protein
MTDYLIPAREDGGCLNFTDKGVYFRGIPIEMVDEVLPKPEPERDIMMLIRESARSG